MQTINKETDARIIAIHAALKFFWLNLENWDLDTTGDNLYIFSQNVFAKF